MGKLDHFPNSSMEQSAKAFLEKLNKLKGHRTRVRRVTLDNKPEDFTCTLLWISQSEVGQGTHIGGYHVQLRDDTRTEGSRIYGDGLHYAGPVAEIEDLGVDKSQYSKAPESLKSVTIRKTVYKVGDQGNFALDSTYASKRTSNVKGKIASIRYIPAYDYVEVMFEGDTEVYTFVSSIAAVSHKILGPEPIPSVRQ